MSKLDLRYQNGDASNNFFCNLLPCFVTHETKESQYLKTERDLEIA